MRIIFAALIISAFCLAGCNNDNGTSGGGNNQLPTITSMNPAQAANGSQHVQGTINGTNLSGATAVNLGPDVNVETFSSVSDTQVNVKFSVSPFASAGARQISVTCAKGTANSNSVFSIKTVIVAKFSVSPAKGDTNTIFHFDASPSTDSEGKITEFTWNFGDGNSGNGKSVDHKYGKASQFSVALHIKDDKGLATSTHGNVTVDKPAETVCTVKLPYKKVGVWGTILSVDGNTVTWKTDKPNTCATAYYWCGDFNDPTEKDFYGFVCSMSDLGGSTFKVGLKHGKDTPTVGQEAFIKAADCTKKDPCL